MSDSVKDLLNGYIVELQNIYGKHLQSVILYGSYARGDFTRDSDVDIMILLNLTDEEIKEYRHQLSEYTYDFYIATKAEAEEQIATAVELLEMVQKYCNDRLSE